MPWIGAASPKTASGCTTVSRHASAMIVPAEKAFGLIHATVFAGAWVRIRWQMSSVASISPPGVSMSRTTAPAPSREASRSRRSSDRRVI